MPKAWNSRIPKANKKRLGILDFRILEFLAQGYDFTLTSAMMPALNYWSSLITFC
ncbi:hypothetical protein [Campylobacter magnus]|uniref:hypothetical protein n=1 Tax=Campylobacter magnus TaxID=3026462 RepID=UPI0026E0ADCF|nr:hypothetical protein [Campylobacter magnus]MDO2408454.1 hypothetical protein [Campylobacter magnus]